MFYFIYKCLNCGRKFSVEEDSPGSDPAGALRGVMTQVQHGGDKYPHNCHSDGCVAGYGILVAIERIAPEV